MIRKTCFQTVHSRRGLRYKRLWSGVLSALPPKADKFSGYSCSAAALGLALNRNKTARNGWMPSRARAKKHCRAVHVIKGGVEHRLVAFWVRLNFQCFVRKFATEHFKFDLVQCAIFAHSSHPFLAIHGRAATIDFQKSPQRHPLRAKFFTSGDKGPLVSRS